MSKLAGYRTILINLLLFVAGLSGHHLSPEVVGKNLDLIFGAIGAINVFMRIVTTGPVGQLVPQLAIVAKLQARFAALLDDMPTISLPSVSIVTVRPADPAASAPQPQPDVPAPAAAGQSDIVALLPIDAASIAIAVNQALSETNKAN